MSIYNSLTWPAIDTVNPAVCALQTMTADTSLIFNGVLANNDQPNQVSFITALFIRSISITSTSDLSAITFTVVGLQNNAFVTETIMGPNNTTVFGTQYYDVIIAITPDTTNAGMVSVGTGDAGYLPLITVNTNNISGNVNYSYSVLVPSGSGITYGLYQTLDSVTENWISFQNQLNSSGNFFEVLTPTQTGPQLQNSLQITNYLLFQVVSSSTPTTDTLTFIFLQE